MKYIYIVLFIGGFFYQCSTAPKGATPTESNPYQAILDSIYNANPQCVGLMAHIEAPQQGVSWSGAVGYDNKNKKSKVHPNQPALVASNTKTYVSATILRLVEMKKLDLNDAIADRLPENTQQIMKKAGYDLNAIKIKHLLSHTSGVRDYVNDKYLGMLTTEPKHRWTRDEQLALAFEQPPLYEAQTAFSYCDANYLLLTEIIEEITGKPFYDSMRELLKYEELGLVSTWFYTLEPTISTTMPLVYQYDTSEGYDSFGVDPSFDLYGGGGIATTTKELAWFAHNLFTGKIIEDEEVLNQIYEIVETKDGLPLDYGMGISFDRELNAVGHGGFWGTTVMYFPEKNMTISVFVLDRDYKHLRQAVLKAYSDLF